VIPQATKVAWTLKSDELMRDAPGLTRRRFVYNLSRADYEREWGRGYHRPGIGTRILTFFIKLLPKVGPLRAVQFKTPTQETSKLFMYSFNKTVDVYGRLLNDLRRGPVRLENKDFDTGAVTSAGEYRLADETYSKLARKLSETGRRPDPKLREDVLAFFADAKKPISVERHKKEWRRTVAAVAKLRAEAPNSPPKRGGAEKAKGNF
jgi:hypothetical protein